MTSKPYFFYIVCNPVIHCLRVNYDILSTAIHYLRLFF